MTNPGNISGAMPAGEDYLVRRMAAIEQDIREMKQAVATQTGMNFVAGQIYSAGFDGDIDDGLAGTVGWGLGGPSGNAVFNNIVLRGGIIGDDALTNPVSPLAIYNQRSNFAVTVNDTDLLTTVVNVPAGFSQALVTATANAQAVNTGVASSLAIGLFIDLEIPPTLSYVPPGGALPGSAASSYSTVLSGLGSTFTITTHGYAFPTALGAANTLNSVSMAAMIMFLR